MSSSGTPAVAAAADGPLHGYTPRPDAFDEMLEREGRPRPHWISLARAFRQLGAEEMARRWEQARRLIRDNGVTYNVYGDPLGMDRPWKLDAVPLLLPPAEWRLIAAGLEQRATLLNLILADLHGPQRLLHDGRLPPELVFAHPGFLRPCHGSVPAERRFLHLNAADLARAPSGGWWVLGDRTQAPSGAGYALENRLALSRALPELFRDCEVVRLAAFFATLRATLVRLAPRQRDNPRIVVLTPGPYNETYFEHAYLARYLGFGLVEGGDLTVRDGIVYMKTLEGLQPVDVILRRVDDDFCDPLSLRGDSSLGVPGLVQAARHGTVVVANALGSGLVESPALLAFLPELCRDLLGEELRLPSVATWWCGDPATLTYVEDHLDGLVIKPAFPGTGMEPVFAVGLSAGEREALIRRMRARPYAFVAQERIALSTAPTWENGRLQPRHVTLRAFCAATATGYAVMPGGLTRVAETRDSLVVSMQRGGGSKDTWVIAGGPMPAFSLLGEPGHGVELSRGGNELPSRVADDLFWLGRYLARAEGTVRLLRATLRRLASESDPSATPGLPALLDTLAAAVGLGDAAGIVDDVSNAAALEQALVACARATEPDRALRPTLAAALRLAAIVRDRISPDTWRVLTELERGLAALVRPRAPSSVETLDELNRLVLAFAAFGGLATDGMTRTQGWRFTDIGRRLERTRHAVGLLRTALVRPRGDEAAALDAVLEVADVAITYRRRYLGTVLAEPVLDLLLLDETNPRAVVFELATLEEHVRQLPRAHAAPFRSPEERLAAGALARVRLADVVRLGEVGADGTRDALEALLVSLAQDLPALADVLTQRYLSHALPVRSLGGA